MLQRNKRHSDGKERYSYMIRSTEASLDKMFVEWELERSKKATGKPRKDCLGKGNRL